MIVLIIRTDNPEAEIGLFEDSSKFAYKKWHAHRELAETLLSTIERVLTEQELNWHDISGIVVYKGPGSFTGLRIGISVANSLAYANHIPIVATTESAWILEGVKELLGQKTNEYIVPEYGSAARVTEPRK